MKTLLLAAASLLLTSPIALAQHSNNYNSNYLAVRVEKIERKGLFKIIGNFRKNSPNGCGFAQVTFNLYDKQNRIIGTATDSMTNLPAHTDWRFSAASFDNTDNFYRYEVIEKICD